MFLGHYGVALAARRASSSPSLGTFVLAAQLLDLVWPVLVLVGVEHVEVVPGLMEASPLDFVHYPWTHSLAAAAVWALAAGLGYRALRGAGVGAWVVGGLVLSHWLLDVVVHRPDLPLWPGSDAFAGGGLWSSLEATLAIEVGLLVVGVAVYLRTTRPLNGRGRWGFWGGVLLLAGFFAASLLAPPPPSGEIVAWSALALWMFVPWGYWVDRHRAPRRQVGRGDLTYR